MDKNTAANLLSNADVSTYDIAHSIYLATVKGISGANQNQGMGFNLSAMAELWNIRGVVGNPNAKTKITGRYKGMGVTEDMILNVVSKYPSGFNEKQPLFDDLLDFGRNHGQVEYYEADQPNVRMYEDTGDDISQMTWICLIGAFVVLKLFVGWGWIASIFVSFLIAGIVNGIRKK